MTKVNHTPDVFHPAFRPDKRYSIVTYHGVTCAHLLSCQALINLRHSQNQSKPAWADKGIAQRC